MISAATEPSAGVPVKTGAFCLEGICGAGPFLRLAYRANAPPQFEETADGGGTLWLPAESSQERDPLLIAVADAAPRREMAVCSWAGGESLAGIALVRGAAADLARATQEVYDRLFAAARGYNLCRIWNWVPDINHSASGDPEEENYRQFCLGRSAAFAASFGDAPERWMPAGTAVGLGGDTLAVLFAATRAPVGHRENPRQVPAYRYPALYGPRPPSFARATITGPTAADDGSCLFISGTASIIASESRFPEDLAGQLRVTFENLRLMGVEAGSSAEGVACRHFRVYYRRREDLPAVKDALRGSLLRKSDRAVFVLADICRRELLVEIEATLLMGAGKHGDPWTVPSTRA